MSDAAAGGTDGDDRQTTGIEIKRARRGSVERVAGRAADLVGVEIDGEVEGDVPNSGLREVCVRMGIVS
jgi:hypothetical protein